ncbi:MAG: hypothetical protein ACRDMV_14360 [Streptosporangiales bacterium]
MKKYLKWVVIAVIAYWAITNPIGAAHLAHQGQHLFTQAAHAMSAFVGAM